MRARRAELLLLLGLGPALLALGPRWLVSVGILASGLLAGAALLLDRTFPRGALWGPATRREAGRVLARTAIACAVVFAAAALLSPRPLFALPRQRPVAWALIMLLYPISAYAQEVAYRTFFFHRYGALFAQARSRVLVSAAFFGWAHVAVNNWLAMGLATVLGLLLSSTYERTRANGQSRARKPTVGST